MEIKRAVAKTDPSTRAPAVAGGSRSGFRPTALPEELQENRCYSILRQARWPQGVTCPRCKGSRVTTHSKFTRTPRRRYLCLSCRKTFTDLTGTPFARSNIPLNVWFRSLDLLESARPARTADLSRRLGVKWDTVSYIQRRLDGEARKADLVEFLRRAIRKNAG